MKLTIELTSREGAVLSAAARSKGIPDSEMAREFVLNQLPGVGSPAPTAAAPENGSPAAGASRDPTVALLDSWLEEDATEDPEEMRKAEQELEEFKRNLNSPRKEAGQRLLFPEIE